MGEKFSNILKSRIRNIRGTISGKSSLIYITDKCNYACNYCIWKKDRYNISEDNFDRLIRIHNEIKTITPNIIGGEPTLYQGLEHFLEKIKIPFILSTNLSAPISLYGKIIKKCDVRLFVAFHRSNVCDCDEFVKKINLLSKICNISLRIMVEDNDSNFYFSLAKKVHPNKIRFAPILRQGLLYKYNNIDYSPYYTSSDIFKFYISLTTGEQLVLTEFDFLPNIGSLGNIECDVKKFQARFHSNGDFYFCRLNNKPLFNINNVSDEYIKNYILQDNVLFCNNVECDLGTVRIGNKKIVQGNDKGLEIFDM